MTREELIKNDASYIASCVKSLQEARTDEDNEDALINLFDSLGLHPRTFLNCMMFTRDNGVRIDGLCLTVKTRSDWY